MSEEKKQINIGINDGDEFFAHELSINFNPMQFILDFKCVTPRVDVRTKDVPFISVRHNVIMVDPYHAKRIVEVLSNTVENYEKQFGRIEKPKALKKLEKKQKKIEKSEQKTQAPSYLG